MATNKKIKASLYAGINGLYSFRKSSLGEIIINNPRIKLTIVKAEPPPNPETSLKKKINGLPMKTIKIPKNCRLYLKLKYLFIMQIYRQFYKCLEVYNNMML